MAHRGREAVHSSGRGSGARLTTNVLVHDIAPALALGMQGIWVDYTRTGLPKAAPCVPSRIIGALPELLMEE